MKYFKTKNLIIFILTLIILLSGFLFWNVNRGDNNQIIKLNNFTKCLSEKGMTMYGLQNCHWCQKQKSDFGDAWQYINYVECSNDPNGCLAKGVQSFPTWFLNGEKIVGYQKLEDLSNKTGCAL